MKEAIGTSYVFSLIITFVGILIAIYVGSIAYSKGFKIRNKIIDIIELHEGYDYNTIDEIDANLASIGYRVTDRKCTERSGATLMNSDSAYNYCVYEYNVKKGVYYGVTVFIHFDIPLIGDFFEIPLYGETRLTYIGKDVIE